MEPVYVIGGIVFVVGALMWLGGRAWGRRARAQNSKKFGPS